MADRGAPSPEAPHPGQPSPGQPHPVFDAYADRYVETVTAGIRLSGEHATYFPALKARLAAGLVGARQARAILDFGCGIGMTTRALAAEFAGARVTGVDESAESLAAGARALSPDEAARVRFEHVPGATLPFADGTFDVVFVSNVFHHIPPGARAAAARELARVAAPGAWVLVFELNPYNPLTVRVTRAIPFDAGVALLPPGETRRLLAAAGVGDLDARYYFFFPRALRALRVLEPALGWLPLGAHYLVAGRRRG